MKTFPENFHSWPTKKRPLVTLHGEDLLPFYFEMVEPTEDDSLILFYYPSYRPVQLRELREEEPEAYNLLLRRAQRADEHARADEASQSAMKQTNRCGLSAWGELGKELAIALGLLFLCFVLIWSVGLLGYAEGWLR